MSDEPACHSCANNNGGYCRVYQQFVSAMMSCISNWVAKGSRRDN